MMTRSDLFVDTSAWVSMLGNDEQYHQEVSAAYLQALRQKRSMVTTSHIIAELIALLINRRVVSHERMIEFIDSLKASRHLSIVHVDQAADDEGWALIKARTDKRWSLADATSFIIMDRMGLTEALTTDHHFAQASFVCVPNLPH